MNKKELVKRVSKQTGIMNEAVWLMLDTVIETIKTEVNSGGDVMINGFGRWAMVHSEKRVVNDMRRGRSFVLPACEVPKFFVSRSWRKQVFHKTKEG